MLLVLNLFFQRMRRMGLYFCAILGRPIPQRAHVVMCHCAQGAGRL